jgi:RNA polymerase sigma factor (sigma-70 family)
VWLCQIAKNTYFTYLQKQRRYDETAEVPEGRTCDSNIEAIVMNKEETLRIHQIVHKLNEPYKEVFTLRVFGELSFKQISQLFEKTESWARVTFHRAKYKIQSKLEED